MEKILSLAGKNAEEAEVYRVISEETSVRFEANKLKQLQTRQQTNVALRIVKNGKTGYATSTEMGDGRDLVNNAVETAEFGTVARFQLPGKLDYPEVDILDKTINSISIKEMIGLGEDMIATVTSHTEGIVCEASVSRGIVTVKILNSRGGRAEYQKSFFSLGIEGTLIDGTDILFVGDHESSCHPITESRNVIKNTLRQLDLAKNQAKTPTRQLPVILTPEGMESAVVPPLVAAFNGKTVLQGASPIGERMGEKVFDEKFHLHDNPLIGYRPGSRPCDDEGVPSRRTALVENGRVSSFYYDLQTAALSGKESTGNGSRGRGLPSPGPSTFIISPGDTTLDEMIADIKEGLIVEYLMGASQGNVLGGDFSGNVLLGYKIENGEVVGRVKDTMVSGNIYHVLDNITAIGSEAKWVGSSLQTPPIYLPGLAVASK
ncbi:MAG: TldD/PmbA family protein [Dehalococcoidia bacterium]